MISSDFQSNLNFNFLIMLIYTKLFQVYNLSADAKNDYSKDKDPSAYDSLLLRLIDHSYKGMGVKVC